MNCLALERKKTALKHDVLGAEGADRVCISNIDSPTRHEQFLTTCDQCLLSEPSHTLTDLNGLPIKAGEVKADTAAAMLANTARFNPKRMVLRYLFVRLTKRFAVEIK